MGNQTREKGCLAWDMDGNRLPDLDDPSLEKCGRENGTESRECRDTKKPCYGKL